jgi:hypothetical protein
MSSNYPNGFAAGVTIRGIPLLQLHPGEVFWVNNSSVLANGQDVNGSNSNEGSFRKPFSTLTYAITQCVANRGDIIVLGVGHNESLAAGGAGALTLDVAGVAIVGTGVGSLRSAITSTGATDTIVISAANMSFSNISFEAGVADVATGLDISAVDGLSFDNCYFTEGAAAGTFNYVDVINLATGADNFSMSNCFFGGRDTNNDQCIVGVAHDGFYIDRCTFFAAVAQATAVPLLDFTGAVTNMEIKDSEFYNNVDAGFHIISDQATNSGVIRDCMFGGADTADSNTAGVNVTGAHCFECYFTGDAASWAIAGGGTAIYNSAA